ncbi:MAG: hypothetical protein WDO73_35460 [Ignavibacteriota bacterium]
MANEEQVEGLAYLHSRSSIKGHRHWPAQTGRDGLDRPPNI